MDNGSVRFLHASDLGLHRTPWGFVELPERYKEAVLDAACSATLKMVEAAQREHVEFVIVSGGWLDPRQVSPRTLVFLREQLQTLSDHEVAVYWSAPHANRGPWQAFLKDLPAGVHVFADKSPTHLVHTSRHGGRISISGTAESNRAHFHPELFTRDRDHRWAIAVGCGRTTTARLQLQDMDYWALGGSDRRKTKVLNHGVAHYPGPPQGWTPRQAGAHGCTLVEFEEGQLPQLHLVPLDSLRWHQELIDTESLAGLDELRQHVMDRAESLISSALVPLFVEWKFTGHNWLWKQVAHGSIQQELLQSLREEFGRRSPWLWSLELSAERTLADLQARQQEDTLLGEFLREAARLASSESGALELEPFIDAAQPDKYDARLASVGNPAARERLLRGVASLGTELLSGEELAT